MLDSDVLYDTSATPLEVALFKLQMVSKLYEAWNKTGKDPNSILMAIGLALETEPGGPISTRRWNK